MTTRTATTFLALDADEDLALFRAALQPLGDGAEVPTEIVVLPAGAMTGHDGRRFDNADPASVVAAFRAGGRDLPVDLEHATHIKGPEGDPAPAVGWVTGLAVKGGALVATIAWNADGRELIARRAYRYVSPAFRHDAAGRVIALASIGLTNTPNLRLPALNRRDPDTMDRKKLTTLLKLKDDATDADIEAAIGVALNSARTPDPSLYVPKADLDAALNRATAAEGKLADQAKATAEAEAVALVDGAIKDGKIAPASRDHYMALCRAGQVETVKAMIGSLPKLGPATTTKTEGEPDKDKGGTLAEHELAICRQLGVKPEEFAKHRSAAAA